MTNETSNRTTAQGADPEAILSSIAPRWGWFVLSGVLAIVFGLIALFAPIPAVYAMTIIWGAFAFADGMIALVSGIGRARRGERHWWAFILRGALGIMASAVVLIMPHVATLALTVFTWTMMAIWSIAIGIAEITAAIRLRREIEGEWLLALSGILSLVLGAAIPVLLMVNPAASVVAMGTMIGAWALLHGILSVGLGLRLRRLAGDGR